MSSSVAHHQLQPEYLMNNADQIIKLLQPQTTSTNIQATPGIVVKYHKNNKQSEKEKVLEKPRQRQHYYLVMFLLFSRKIRVDFIKNCDSQTMETNLKWQSSTSFSPSEAISSENFPSDT